MITLGEAEIKLFIFFPTFVAPSICTPTGNYSPHRACIYPQALRNHCSEQWLGDKLMRHSQGKTLSHLIDYEAY